METKSTKTCPYSISAVLFISIRICWSFICLIGKCKGLLYLMRLWKRGSTEVFSKYRRYILYLYKLYPLYFSIHSIMVIPTVQLTWSSSCKHTSSAILKKLKIQWYLLLMVQIHTQHMILVIIISLKHKGICT